MPTPTCTKCRRVIPSADINVAQDVAYCRECNLSHRLSRLTYDLDINPNLNLQSPPKGAWHVNHGGSTIIGATNRSPDIAFGSLVFGLFWNGLLSLFVAVAIAGTLHNLHLPVPTWFPAPKMNGEDMTSSMTLFVWLFLTPFILFGVFMAGACLMSLFGRTEVRLENTRATAFAGVGSLGWKRTFDASEVKDVRLHAQRNNEGSDRVTILIETRLGKQLKLGSMFSNERRLFVLGALRRTLLK